LLKVLVTERLRLDPAGWGDAPFLWRLIGDAQVRRYLGGPVPRKRRLAWLRHCLARQAGTAVWVVRQDGARIGLVSLTPHKDGAAVELSYQFSPAAWGRGLAAEACAAVLALARNAIGPTEIIAETQAANHASRRLLARLGMVETGRVTRFGAEQVLVSTQGGAAEGPGPPA
jgi:ribosomal-protein-alanine N-acetyltransferase